jgi:hypothetical protein
MMSYSFSITFVAAAVAAVVVFMSYCFSITFSKKLFFVFFC